MLLSRFWYVVIALAVGAALYVAFLSVGQFNRRAIDDLKDGVAADQGKVELFLKLDARRRLDQLIVASNTALPDILKKASKEKTVPAGLRADAAKEIDKAKKAIKPEQLAPDALFVVDAEGRVIGQSGYDAVKLNDEFELGGYPAVFDALHGFSRDDTWVWPDPTRQGVLKLYLVVARPIETDIGGAPVGAVVGLKEFDAAYATYVASKTFTSVGFYVQGKIVASATGVPGFDDGLIAQIVADDQLTKLMEDPKSKYKEEGRSELRELSSTRSSQELAAAYVRLTGDAWDQNAGFGVIRSNVRMTGPMDFLNGATDKDKQSVPLIIIILAVVGATLLGIGFTVFEHTLPANELARQAEALRDGKIDALQVARLRGSYRLAAQNINNGMERIIEKGGGVPRKAADLESILGPVPAQPAMSAFSFPLQDGQVAAAQAAPPPPPVPSAPASVPGRPPPSNPQSARDVSKATPAVPVQLHTAPVAFSAPTPSPAARQGPPPPLNVPPVPMKGPGGPPPAPVRGAPAPAPPPPPPPAPAPMGKVGGEDSEDDEATMVAAIPAEVLAQATGENRKADNEAGEWLTVYEDFIRTKKQCGEPTDGLTFEKFQHTLKKNRDALMARHGCKRVRFSVYVKEGRASLKATPVKD